MALRDDHFGSAAGLPDLLLFAVDLSVKLVCHRADEPESQIQTTGAPLRAPESVQGPICGTAEELKRLLIQRTKRFGQGQQIGLEMLFPYMGHVLGVDDLEDPAVLGVPVDLHPDSGQPPHCA
jgi:hypothetical protein